jgi:signal recognition particle receptor subunit beta
VAGPYAARKTQFINTISEIETVKTEARTTRAREKEKKTIQRLRWTLEE